MTLREFTNSVINKLMETDAGGVELIKNTIINIAEETSYPGTWSDLDYIFTDVCFELENRRLLATVICR